MESTLKVTILHCLTALLDTELACIAGLVIFNQNKLMIIDKTVATAVSQIVLSQYLTVKCK